MKKIYLLLFSALFSLYALSQSTLNLKLYLQSYYVGAGLMKHVLQSCGASGSNPNQTDTILVELHDTIVPSTIAFSTKVILMRDGTAACTFSSAVNGNAYYIVVKHKITVETWSAAPVIFSAVTNYDFSTAVSKAYGNNMVLVGNAPAIWAFYSADINQDGNIDQIDFPVLDFGINNGLFGCYASDLNGDGNTDLLDFPVLDSNICAGIYSHHP